MKHQLFDCVLSATLVVILSSCSNSKVNGFSEIVPLSDGNKWEYNIEYTNQSQNVQKGRMIRRVDGKEKIKNNDYFKIVSVFSGIPGAESQTYYYRKAVEGYFAINGQYKEFPEWLEIKFPLEVGRTWKYSNPLGDFDIEIIGIETVELIDKKFENCIKIKYHNSSRNWSGYTYLANGIGVVKEVDNINGITYDYTIDKFNVDN